MLETLSLEITPISTRARFLGRYYDRNNVTIGANAIPDNAVVTGVLARILRLKSE